MVKGIINASDFMEFCLVIDLKIDGNRVVKRHQYLLLGVLVLLLPCIPGQVTNTCYPQKKIISNTAFHMMLVML